MKRHSIAGQPRKLVRYEKVVENVDDYSSDEGKNLKIETLRTEPSVISQKNNKVPVAMEGVSIIVDHPKTNTSVDSRKRRSSGSRTLKEVLTMNAQRRRESESNVKKKDKNMPDIDWLLGRRSSVDPAQKKEATPVSQKKKKLDSPLAFIQAAVRGYLTRKSIYQSLLNFYRGKLFVKTLKKIYINKHLETFAKKAENKKNFEIKKNKILNKFIFLLRNRIKVGVISSYYKMKALPPKPKKEEKQTTTLETMLNDSSISKKEKINYFVKQSKLKSVIDKKIVKDKKDFKEIFRKLRAKVALEKIKNPDTPETKIKKAETVYKKNISDMLERLNLKNATFGRKSKESRIEKTSTVAPGRGLRSGKKAKAPSKPLFNQIFNERKTITQSMTDWKKNLKGSSPEQIKAKKGYDFFSRIIPAVSALGTRKIQNSFKKWIENAIILRHIYMLKMYEGMVRIEFASKLYILDNYPQHIFKTSSFKNIRKKNNKLTKIIFDIPEYKSERKSFYSWAATAMNSRKEMLEDFYNGGLIIGNTTKNYSVEIFGKPFLIGLSKYKNDLSKRIALKKILDTQKNKKDKALYSKICKFLGKKIEREIIKSPLDYFISVDEQDKKLLKIISKRKLKKFIRNLYKKSLVNSKDNKEKIHKIATLLKEQNQPEQEAPKEARQKQVKKIVKFSWKKRNPLKFYFRKMLLLSKSDGEFHLEQ